MTVLVLNCGSSSLKCQLFSLPAEQVLARGAVERVGQGSGRLSFERPGAEPVVEERPFATHAEAIGRVLALLADPPGEPLPPIDAVGHRVVHAGEAFTGSVPVEPEVIAALEACCDLAPLHNPPNLAGIRACLAALPGLPNVAVFDNALHHTLPPEVYLYGLPRRFHTDHRVRRYGFHGIAFRSIAAETERILGRRADELRLVMLMLGSGTTANAQRNGRSIAISTGFTPLEGLVQGTRCGDLDPGIVIALLRAGYQPAELNTLFNQSSGLKGLSGLSADLRDIEQADSASARLAEDVFVHRAIKYVGGYAADLGGLDVLAFGGGIGQNAPALRARICEPFAHLGLSLDLEANQALAKGSSGRISSASSTVEVVVTAVDEELVIARECHTVVTSSQYPRAKTRV